MKGPGSKLSRSFRFNEMVGEQGMKDEVPKHSSFHWKVSKEHQPSHFFCDRPEGRYLIGPRKDGFWEYDTPLHDWGSHRGHTLDNLSREEAFRRVEAVMKEHMK